MKQIKQSFILIVLMSIFGTKTFAYDAFIDGFYYNFNGNTAEVTYDDGFCQNWWDYSFNGNGAQYSGYITIPQSVTYNGSTYSVTSIGYNAFSSSQIERVEIPSTVISIGNSAFANCTNLIYFNIPSSVKEIGDYAFGECTNLASIDIPNSIEQIGINVFTGTAWYNNLSNGVIYVGKCLYDYKGTMPKNTSISVNEGTMVIASDAFKDCSGLKSISFPNSLVSIGRRAFSGCSALKSVTIPNSVTSIDYYAFESCTNLTSVNISNAVKSIYEVFKGCTSLISVEIPNSVTNISGAFEGCTGLASVVLSNSLTSIGNKAFKGCTSLASIDILSSVTSIDSYAFQGCTNLNSVVIPSSVTTIGDYAFQNCSSLADLTIPSSVTSIGTAAFEGTAWYNNQPDGVQYQGNTVIGYKGTMSENTFITLKDGTESIAAGAFMNCYNLSGIYIPNTVVSIGNNAFQNCTSLKSISIPNSVTTIGYSAFYGCNNLEKVFFHCAKIGSWFSSNKSIKEIVIGEEVTSIDYSAFYGCSSLNAVHISNIASWCGITFNSDNPLQYAHHLYMNNQEITDLVIPNSVTKISSSAFKGCSALNSVTISSSVTNIGYGAFSDCTGLTSVEIPNSVTNISGAFSGCTSLSNVIIPNSVTNISGAFEGCTGLTSVVLSNSLTSIGNRAFKDCTSLASIDILSSVTSIDSYAFQGCTSLRYINIPNSIKYIEKNSFSGCSGLSMTFHCKVIGNWFDFSENVENIILGDEVTEISAKAFINCSGLKSITLGNTAIKFGAMAFGGHYEYQDYDQFYNLVTVSGDSKCEKLEKVIIPNLSAWFNSEFTYLYGTTEYPNPLWIAQHLYSDENTEITDLVIPDGVTSIDYNYVSGSKGLTSVTIPSSVTNIGDYAFSGCSSLISAVIPSSVIAIGSMAFYGCKSLAAVNIPSGVSSISSSAFSGCSGMTSLTISEGVTSIGEGSFSGCSGLTSLTLPASLTSISYSAFSGCSGLTSITVEAANSKYDSRDNCNAIIETSRNTLVLGCKNTNIPSSVTSIGNNAFNNCDGLTSITIPSSITSIGNNAFNNCDGLTSITIPSSITSIGNSAFSNCDGLASVTISEGVTSIGDYAFAWCKNLTSATIPLSVTNIGYNAFDGTPLYDNQPNGLVYIGNVAYKYKGTMPTNSAIVIKDGTTAIADGAFEWCPNMTSVTIPSTVTRICNNAFYYCNNLKAVYISDLASWCKTSFGSNPLQYAHHLYLNNQEIKDLVIPSGVTSINSSAFTGCYSLTSVNIPEGVTSIGNSAFNNCSSLSTVTIPSSVSTIGTNAFFNTRWYDNQPAGLVYAGKVAYKYKGMMPDNTDIVIEDGTLGITGQAFYNCKGLTSVSIPSSVTNIGYYAFGYCQSLTSITIPENVTSIGSYAFDECKNLTSVTAERKTPVELNNYTFSNRTNATLYVPYKCKTSYEAADYWNEFKEIIEMELDSQPGDINGDGIINGIDLVAQTNLIMTDQYDAAADLNNDGEVNGLDYVIMVNLIMSFTSAPSMQAPASNRAASIAGLSIEDFDIKAGETKEMFINLSNPGTELTLLQFDMRLPEGLSIATEDGDYAIDIAGRTTWKKHSLMAKGIDGATRFLLASNSNALIDGDNGNVISIKLTASSGFNGGDIKLKNQLLVSPDAKDMMPADYIYAVGGVTSIDAVMTGEPVDVYTLTGTKVRHQTTSLEGLPKGAYIIKGKKVIVK